MCMTNVKSVTDFLLIQYFYTKIKISFADIKGISTYFQSIELLSPGKGKSVINQCISHTKILLMLTFQFIN